ncbi:MAG: HEPN domain-containing protein [Flavobacteriaceae bacterium]|nr:MAG: HEPN domain-containing protein [Flavobacteriaceae bacterium]
MSKIIQPKDIYKQALAFEKCAKILHEQYDFWDNSTKIGGFMNEALSVELYLKAILLFEKNEIKRTHHFDELFKLLSEESQNEIISLFNNSIDNKKEQEKSLLESIYNSEFTSELIEILPHYKNLFVDVRYKFENKPIYPIIYLSEIRESLKKRCNNLGIL